MTRKTISRLRLPLGMLAALSATAALACQSISYSASLRNDVYCLASDIELAAPFDLGDDTTLDCKGHKISNPTSSLQFAVLASGDNIVLKNCVFDGFMYPVEFTDVTNYRIEGNTFLSPLAAAVDASGNNDHGFIARNSFRYAAAPPAGFAPDWYDGSSSAILVGGLADIIGNTVTSAKAAVTGVTWNSQYGIESFGNQGGVIAFNVLRGLNLVRGGRVGIIADGEPVIYRNVLIARPPYAYQWDYGVSCQGSGSPLAKDNLVLGFAIPYVLCVNHGSEGMKSDASRR